MAELTTTRHFEPGAPNKNNTGPMYAPGQHDDLLLPNGSTVGQTSNEVLRPMLARFIEGAHTRPRNEIVAEYAAALTETNPTSALSSPSVAAASRRPRLSKSRRTVSSCVTQTVRR